MLSRLTGVGLFVCVAASPALAGTELAAPSTAATAAPALAPVTAPAGTASPAAAATAAPGADTTTPPASAAPPLKAPRQPSAHSGSPAMVAMVLPGKPAERSPAAGVQPVATRPVANNCALSFDDGPSDHTGKLLDLLAQHHIRATFFVLGQQARRHPDLIRRMQAEGHDIGTHSIDHPDMRKLSPDNRRRQISDPIEYLKTLGITATLFRPPYGAYDKPLLELLDGMGQKMVLWSRDSRDWKTRSTEGIRQNLLHSGPPGFSGIYLFHDTRETTLAAMPDVLGMLEGRGCQFVTISKWIEDLPLPSSAQAAETSGPGPGPGPALTGPEKEGAPVGMGGDEGNAAPKPGKETTPPDVKPEAKADVKAEPKPDAKPDTKTEPKPEAKPDVKAETKPDAKAEPKPEAKPDAKPDAKPETKPEAKAEKAVPGVVTPAGTSVPPAAASGTKAAAPDMAHKPDAPHKESPRKEPLPKETVRTDADHKNAELTSAEKPVQKPRRKRPAEPSVAEPPAAGQAVSPLPADTDMTSASKTPDAEKAPAPALSPAGAAPAQPAVSGTAAAEKTAPAAEQTSDKPAAPPAAAKTAEPLPSTDRRWVDDLTDFFSISGKKTTPAPIAPRP